MDEKLRAIWASAVAKIKELWNKNKILFFILIPLILIVKFRDILIKIIVSGGKALLDKTAKEDAKLKQEANSANNQANKIISNADKLDDNKPAIDEDWNKR